MNPLCLLTLLVLGPCLTWTCAGFVHTATHSLWELKDFKAPQVTHMYTWTWEVTKIKNWNTHDIKTQEFSGSICLTLLLRCYLLKHKFSLKEKLLQLRVMVQAFDPSSGGGGRRISVSSEIANLVYSFRTDRVVTWWNPDLKNRKRKENLLQRVILQTPEERNILRETYSSNCWPSADMMELFLL